MIKNSFSVLVQSCNGTIRKNYGKSRNENTCMISSNETIAVRLNHFYANMEYGLLKDEDKFAGDEYQASKTIDAATSLQYCCVPRANCVYNGHKRYDALDLNTLPVTTIEEDEKYHNCEPYNLGEPIVKNMNQPGIGIAGLHIFLIGTRNIVRLFMIDTMANDYMVNSDRTLHLLRKKTFVSAIKRGQVDGDGEEIRRGGRNIHKIPPLGGHSIISHWNYDEHDNNDEFKDSNNLLTFFLHYYDVEYYIKKKIKGKVKCGMRGYIIVYDDSNKNNIGTYEKAMEKYCGKDDIYSTFYVRIASARGPNENNDDSKKLMKLNELKHVLSATYFIKKYRIEFDIVDIICQYYGIENVNWNNYDYNYLWSIEKINDKDVANDESLQCVKIKDVMITIYDQFKKTKNGFCHLLWFEILMFQFIPMPAVFY